MTGSPLAMEIRPTDRSLGGFDPSPDRPLDALTHDCTFVDSDLPFCCLTNDLIVAQSYQL